ncbi:ricin-type beta-trefoil lectin domain protein [Embleya sp. NPDC059237]|uniref:ricin-type beta-trefoil lectin domain protein n=1 Tax=Embleya sp. NPDC059237 TaxID=3346784 RepID=UPI0036A44D82
MKGTGKLAIALAAFATAATMTTVTLLPTASADAPATADAPPTATGTIGGWGGFCMDVTGGSSTDRTSVELYTCNSGAGQNWTLTPDASSGTITALGKCLDIPDHNTTDGTPLEIYTCNGGSNQQWKANHDGTITNPDSGLCVTAPGTPQIGVVLQIKTCVSAGGQRWSVPIPVDPTATEAAGPVHGWSDYCMDVTGGNSDDLTPIELYTCNNSTGQNWTRASDHTLRAFGKCLDLNGNNPTRGTRLQLYTCNGRPSQIWVVNSDETLYNPGSGGCAAAAGVSPQIGAQLQLQDCSAHDNQRWILPTTGPVVHSASGSCMDDSNSSTTDGNVVQIFTCNGSGAQQWTFVNGNITVLGTCLHPTTPTQGAVLEIRTCDDTAGQRWERGDHGQIYHPVSGYCVTLPDGNGNDGQSLRLDTCATTSDTFWRTPSWMPTP